MKTINPGLVTLLLTMSALQPTSAQTTFEVPENIELKISADCAKYEPAIIDAAKWPEVPDLDKEKEKQRNVNAFVMQWITGSPIISVYKKGIEISKNKEMKKLIKLTDEKKLDDYIKDKLKITA